MLRFAPDFLARCPQAKEERYIKLFDICRPNWSFSRGRSVRWQAEVGECFTPSRFRSFNADNNTNSINMQASDKWPVMTYNSVTSCSCSSSKNETCWELIYCDVCRLAVVNKIIKVYFLKSFSSIGREFGAWGDDIHYQSPLIKLKMHLYSAIKQQRRLVGDSWAHSTSSVVVFLGRTCWGHSLRYSTMVAVRKRETTASMRTVWDENSLLSST